MHLMIIAAEFKRVRRCLLHTHSDISERDFDYQKGSVSLVVR